MKTFPSQKKNKSKSYFVCSIDNEKAHVGTRFRTKKNRSILAKKK